MKIANESQHTTSCADEIDSSHNTNNSSKMAVPSPVAIVCVGMAGELMVHICPCRIS